MWNGDWKISFTYPLENVASGRACIAERLLDHDTAQWQAQGVKR